LDLGSDYFDSVYNSDSNFGSDYNLDSHPVCSDLNLNYDPDSGCFDSNFAYGFNFDSDSGCSGFDNDDLDLDLALTVAPTMAAMTKPAPSSWALSWAQMKPIPPTWGS
jgi:hypothetical protein